MNLKVALGPLGKSWTFRYLLDLKVSLGPLGTTWTLRYLMELTRTHGIDNRHANLVKYLDLGYRGQFFLYYPLEYSYWTPNWFFVKKFVSLEQTVLIT